LFIHSSLCDFSSYVTDWIGSYLVALQPVHGAVLLLLLRDLRVLP
uniref:Uncharacterized protein n=1 Tax=Aegilops tauschii subsp. strangulata TaxID=200361 RepID=A0A453QMJ9_AEGTS